MGFSFPALPTMAGCCVRVRVKLGSSGVSTPWITRSRFLCKPNLPLGYSRLTRCAGRDGERLPATGRVHVRGLLSPALDMAVRIFTNVEPREFGPLTSAVQRRPDVFTNVCRRSAIRINKAVSVGHPPCTFTIVRAGCCTVAADYRQ
jgi:hypothetical protein